MLCYKKTVVTNLISKIMYEKLYYFSYKLI